MSYPRSYLIFQTFTLATADYKRQSTFGDDAFCECCLTRKNIATQFFYSTVYYAHFTRKVKINLMHTKILFCCKKNMLVCQLVHFPEIDVEAQTNRQECYFKFVLKNNKFSIVFLCIFSKCFVYKKMEITFQKRRVYHQIMRKSTSYKNYIIVIIIQIQIHTVQLCSSSSAVRLPQKRHKHICCCVLSCCPLE